MAKTYYKYLGVLKKGDTFCLDTGIVTNTSEVLAEDVRWYIEFPEESISFSNFSTFGKGTFDPVTYTWSLGNIVVGGEYNGQICFTVIDDCDFPITITVYANALSQCDVYEKKCVKLTATTCCDLSKCLSQADFVTDTTTADGEISVTFDREFDEAPAVTIQGYQNNYLYSIDSVSTTGFTVIASQINFGGSSIDVLPTTSVSFYWIASDQTQ